MRIYNIEFRLKMRNWKPSISTSTHFLYHKRGWQCSFGRSTDEVCFKRVMKADTVELFRGKIEEGIE